MKHWVDGSGTRWTRVGDRSLATSAIQRLIEDASTSVVLFYGVDPVFTDAAERVALWQRMEPVLRGKSVENLHSEFAAFKYRDGSRTMLAIEESC